MRTWPRGIAILVVASVAFVLPGCGDDDDAGGSDTTAAAATTAAGTTAGGSDTTGAAGDVCADRDALSDSISALGDVDIVASGTSGLQTALDDIRSSLTALRSSASADLRPQVDAVEEDLGELEDAIQNVSSGGVTSVVDAVTALAASAQTLLTDLQDLDCG
jgi:hypothetical protein